MSQSLKGDRFYQAMGVVMLILVFSGFGLAAAVRGQNPLDLPLLFHVHGVLYVLWFCLFIYQAALIGRQRRSLHMRLGGLSVLLVVAMLLSGWFMARTSFDRGVSAIPDVSIHQFVAFPFFDLLGLVVFYSLAVVKRRSAEFHKRAMLFALISIMDPAIARIGISVGFPPIALLGSIALVVTVMLHDRRVLHRVHPITWFGFSWIFLRLAFVFGFAATEAWAAIANRLFA